MPTSPRKIEGDAANGFTLVEMLVVLVVIGLVSAAAIQRLPQAGGGRTGFVAAARAALLTARTKAMVDGEVVSAMLPARAEAGMHDGATPASAGIRFFADGSSSGGIVSHEGRASLQIDWLTGHASPAG